MKNFEKELKAKLASEEITLPESLSAENIEKLINEKGSIIELKRKRAVDAKVVRRWASAAAILVVLVGVVSVIAFGGIPQVKKQNISDAEQQQIIENHADVNSDYSELHKTILSYYKDIYNSIYYADSDGILDGFFNGFITKEESAMDMAGSAGNASSGTPSNGTTSDSAGSVESSFSTTNTQVQGVDEADIVKTDGKYIYYIVHNTIRIVECYADAQMNIVSTIKLTEYIDYDFYPSEMYLYGDSLVVVLRENSQYQPVTYNNPYGEICDCVCYAVKTDTVIKCFDISDKTNPKESYTHKMTGEYISSRLTDGKLITVAQFSIPYNSVQADDFDGACEVVKDVSVPEYSVNDGEMKKIPSDRITVFDENKPTDFIVTSIINLNDLTAEPKMNALLGGAKDLYCTREEIFVAETLYMTWSNDEKIIATDDLGNKYETATKVHKMDITDEGVNYIASATVGGMCINQFSMDKYGEYFRIATNGWDFNVAEQKTMVYVLDKNMKIVGFLDNIAPEEQMKSARFMGDVLYLVTFMQTDPLFVVDLSDPEKPEIRGELKIPGFSTYLHPAGDGLLIGVGEGGSMTGTDGTAKISLFDVSDPYNIKELDNYSTGTQASFTGNHKEFVIIDENTYAVTLYYDYALGKVVVFSITDGGIVVDNIYNARTGVYYGNTRGVFIDDNVFVVSAIGIASYKNGNETPVDILTF